MLREASRLQRSRQFLKRALVEVGAILEEVVGRRGRLASERLWNRALASTNIREHQPASVSVRERPGSSMSAYELPWACVSVGESPKSLWVLLGSALPSYDRMVAVLEAPGSSNVAGVVA